MRGEEQGYGMRHWSRYPHHEYTSPTRKSRHIRVQLARACAAEFRATRDLDQKCTLSEQLERCHKPAGESLTLRLMSHF